MKESDYIALLKEEGLYQEMEPVTPFKEFFTRYCVFVAVVTVALFFTIDYMTGTWSVPEEKVVNCQTNQKVKIQKYRGSATNLNYISKIHI